MFQAVDEDARRAAIVCGLAPGIEDEAVIVDRRLRTDPADEAEQLRHHASEYATVRESFRRPKNL
jgi:hypothetical protein